MSAFAALSMRPGNGGWVMMDFDDDAMRTLTELYYQEPTSRSRIVRLFAECECRESTLEARRQLVRDAIYNADLARFSLRAAAELKMLDVIEIVVHHLKHPDEITRNDAATALQIYGRDAARYSNEIREALAQEKSEDVQGILKAALQMIN